MAGYPQLGLTSEEEIAAAEVEYEESVVFFFVLGDWFCNRNPPQIVGSHPACSPNEKQLHNTGQPCALHSALTSTFFFHSPPFLPSHMRSLFLIRRL